MKNSINYKKYHRDKTYNDLESTFRNIFLKRFNILRKYVPQQGRVLDIGCSNGVFLDIFKEAGFETWGVEPSNNANMARIKKHNVLNSSFEIAKLPINYFDVVVMNHTLEHLKNPKQILSKINIILKKGGILLIDVPNVGSLLSKILGKRWPYLLPEEHLWQFNKKSLTKLVKNAGLEVVHWESRSGFFEYANPLRELKRKRFLIDILTLPFTMVATCLNMGDSMSIIAKKK